MRVKLPGAKTEVKPKKGSLAAVPVPATGSGIKGFAKGGLAKKKMASGGSVGMNNKDFMLGKRRDADGNIIGNNSYEDNEFDGPSELDLNPRTRGGSTQADADVQRSQMGMRKGGLASTKKMSKTTAKKIVKKQGAKRGR